jgi:hypothetical protein
MGTPGQIIIVVPSDQKEKLEKLKERFANFEELSGQIIVIDQEDFTVAECGRNALGNDSSRDLKVILSL